MSLLYSIILSCAFLSAHYNNTKSTVVLPSVTLIICGILIITFILQLVYPQTIILFQRNTTAFIAGQVWRIITALFFQDGGIAGAVFNIVALVIIGSAAEQYFSKAQWLILFFSGGIIAGLIGLIWQPIGAGNSIANFALAGGLLTMTSKQSAIIRRALHVIAIVVALYLVSMRDIHGSAVVIGMAITYFFLRKLPSKKKN